MNVRRRSGDMSHPIGGPVRNAATNRKDAQTQAKAVKNAHNAPKPAGYSKVRNAVN